jgi:hypothetical protein
MEKITLKPIVKELIHKNYEPNTHFDVLAYRGASNQEKNLGSLFVLGHVKYEQEDLSYTVSLISSLAKREYYSEASVQTLNPKKSFERTLKKLNEVLDDFFKNKEFKLNIGLFVIAGDNIYISRLGKFKIALARDSKYIDILNNLELFNKDTEGETQFSNIISGKLEANDKILAYFPTRPISSREKLLNNIFVNQNQEEFSQKIDQLSANTANFSCCGVHVAIQQIKEIPIRSSLPTYPKINQASASYSQTPSKVQPLSNTAPDNPGIPAKDNPGDKEQPPTESDVTTTIKESPTRAFESEEDMDDIQHPRIIPAEFSRVKRANLLTPLFSYFSKLSSLGRLNAKTRSRTFITLAAVVVIPLIVFVIFKTGGTSRQVTDAINNAKNNLKLAQSRLTQNNMRDARTLLQAALSNTQGLSDKKITDINKQINLSLDSIDHTSDKVPSMFADLSAQVNGSQVTAISASQNKPYLLTVDGNLLSVASGSAGNLTSFKNNPRFIFDSQSVISVFNGSDAFGTYGLKSKKMTLYTLSQPAEAADSVLYQDNLYTLSENHIYKYADVNTGGTKRVEWGSDSSDGQLMSLTVDGDVYAINTDGKLMKYFKGKKVSDVDLQVIPSAGSRILTDKNSAFIYLADKSARKVYVFDKASGTLNTTYKLDAAGTIKDISVSTDGSVWILSADNKVWSLK